MDPRPSRHQLDESKTRIQFITSAEMPYLIYQACLKTGHPSMTVYCQHAIIDALARDLDLPVDEMVAKLPTNRSRNKHLHHPDDPNARRRVPVHLDPTGGGVVRLSSANTSESVK